MHILCTYGGSGEFETFGFPIIQESRDTYVGRVKGSPNLYVHLPRNTILGNAPEFLKSLLLTCLPQAFFPPSYDVVKYPSSGYP